MIKENTTLLEMAVIVSEALQAAGIDAILGGGGAVTQYSNNEYMSTDLDFITYEQHKTIEPVMTKLGFERPESMSIPSRGSMSNFLQAHCLSEIAMWKAVRR